MLFKLSIGVPGGMSRLAREHPLARFEAPIQKHDPVILSVFWQFRPATQLARNRTTVMTKLGRNNDLRISPVNKI